MSASDRSCEARPPSRPGGANGPDRLCRWFADGTLLRPDPAVPNAVDLALALAALSGAPTPRTDGAAEVAARIGDADHLVFVLVDGLGVETIEAALPPESFLRRHLAMTLRAVFPSATASALTSLATGLWPNRHGVPGWWTYLPDRDLTVTALPFIERWSGDSLEGRVAPGSLFPAATLLPCYRREAASFLPAPIADSAYSRYVRGTTATVPYEALPGAIDAVLARVRGAAAPTYSYLYLSSVDALSHTFGPLTPEVRDHLAGLDQELARLADGLQGRGRMALSADHGLIAVAPERKHLLRAGDPFVDLLRAPPSGEPRAPLLHARPGRADRVKGEFEARFGDAFALLTIDEAADLELFGPGPFTSTARARVGDFVALSGGPDVLLYRPGPEPTGTEKLVGYHGGLLPAEVRIPLVVG
ncbi:MAG: alkaline phosphatase family protein [Planctomycetes bacterium]|nr:alkaline phosphatase family protein [Planctomycetota bacterium]